MRILLGTECIAINIFYYLDTYLEILRKYLKIFCLFYSRGRECSKRWHTQSRRHLFTLLRRLRYSAFWLPIQTIRNIMMKKHLKNM